MISQLFDVEFFIGDKNAIVGSDWVDARAALEKFGIGDCLDDLVDPLGPSVQ